MPKHYILSIDGGGVRGIIPAIALVKLESTTGQLTRDIFRFVAGTSTGAIIAALVAAGIPAAKILDLYLNRTREVITKRPWNWLKLIICGYQYSSSKLRDLLCDELAHNEANNWTLNDSPIDLLITAKRVPDGMPWYFVHDNPRNSSSTGCLKLVDCVTASAAAPTYFDPWTINETVKVPETPKNPKGLEQVGTLVDGGVGVTGNPVYQACVEAFYYTQRYSPQETTHDTVTVSLGTGKFVPKKKPTWIYPWIKWTIDQLLESPEEQQTEIAHRQFPDMHLYRIDTELKEDIPLDGIGSVKKLQAYGERLARLIDWKAILEGSNGTAFRVKGHNTRWDQYKQP